MSVVARAVLILAVLAPSAAAANQLSYSELYAGGTLPVGAGDYSDQAEAGYVVGARGGMELGENGRTAFEVAGDWRAIPWIDEPEVAGETLSDGGISRIRVLAGLRQTLLGTDRLALSVRAAAGIERSTGTITRVAQTDEGERLDERTDPRLGPTGEASLYLSSHFDELIVGLELAAPIAWHDDNPTLVFLETDDSHLSIDLDLRLTLGYRF